MYGHHTSSSPTTDPGDERQQPVLHQFHSFPFSSDEAFQQGLAAILAQDSMNGLSEGEKSKLILKSKVFYFNRVTGCNIHLEDIHAGNTADLDHLHAESGDEPSQPGEIHTLTFTELKNLIEQGKTENIPNNKIIPDTLSDGVPSQSTAPLRKKPWEVESQS